MDESDKTLKDRASVRHFEALLRLFEGEIREITDFLLGIIHQDGTKIWMDNLGITTNKVIAFN